MELYKQYRPTDLSEVVGQPAAVAMLQRMLAAKQVPQALMFAGPSGTGKTTLARILRTALGCSDFDYTELNSAGDGGIDRVRDIRSSMTKAPLSGGRCRVWVLDEAHALTKDAQQMLLKMLEDTPPRVYFFLCTTDSSKLIPTIRTRCTEVRCDFVPILALEKLVQRIAKECGVDATEGILDRVCSLADGSARKALVLLDTIRHVAPELQAASLNDPEASTAAINIARMLFNTGTTWGDMREALKALTDDYETVRWVVLGYGQSVLLGKSSGLYKRAAAIIDEFSTPYYNSKKTGLVRSCFAVVNGS